MGTAQKRVIRLRYLAKMFTEGERARDKIVLLPGTVLRTIAYVLIFLKVPLLPRILNLAARPPIDVMVKNQDGRFYCGKASDDVMFVAEYYELPLRECLERIREGIFVDVGANVGKYTIKIARQIGKRGKVISIEPEPQAFKKLIANINLNNLTNVYPLNVACWNANEEVPLYIGSGLKTTGEHSVKRAVSPHFVKVKALRLDDILKDLGVYSIDWIKIDAEGAEEEILRGMQRTVANSKALKIIFESSDKQALEASKKVLESYRMIIRQRLPGTSCFLAERIDYG